jgi:phosphoribosylformylglycinamidine synthase II
MPESPAVEHAIQLGLDASEYQRILELIQREPNYTELCMFASMWSEHCSYKNSLLQLRKLPRKGTHVLNEELSENAGLVDIGGGYVLAFKIESHNHPSAVEPFQGAATGVGGINRDIFTMGARPFAQLISLRFGEITQKNNKAMRLMKGVISGISHYGNSFGVAIVSGDIFFNDCYNHTPLVNVLSAGIVEKSAILNAVARGEGNPVYIAGSSSGKDGINGAVFASANITDESEAQLPSIQVGDPFAEKLLMEATLEAGKTGEIIAIQDMGAAGILCSSSEMSARGKCGMKIDLDKVPLRQNGMSAEEIILSESQERMLIVLEKGKEKNVENIFKKWNVPLVKIGEVTSHPSLQYFMNGRMMTDINPAHLVAGEGAPVYEREAEEPVYFRHITAYDITQVPVPADLKKIADQLIVHPDLCSKRWAFEQFDSMIGTANMNTNKKYNASLLKIKEINKILALSMSGNAAYVYAHPETGGMIAIAEAAAQIYCTGAKPMAISNCLNFGNPYNKEVYWQFEMLIKGMSKACERFGTPVTGGNVSFYNQSEIDGKNVPVYPTPVIGMLGMMEEGSQPLGMEFNSPGDLIYILGKTQNDISSSVYLSSHWKIPYSPTPSFDLEEEILLMQCTQKLIEKDLLQSAQRISLGGIYMALLKSVFGSPLGFTIDTDEEIRKDAFLFGETQGRILVSVSPEKEKIFLESCAEINMYVYKAGRIITEEEIWIDNTSFGRLEEKEKLFEKAFILYH